MSSDFSNVYDDRQRADAYAELEFPGTYYLAYRDLPGIVAEHVTGKRALDFGCGTGRSTRFLQGLGFEVIGVDISEFMLERARQQDPGGDYRRVPDGNLSSLAGQTFDLILSAFTFDNISTKRKKLELFKSLGGLLARQGCVVNLVSSPEIYTHEWASFSTRDFPENRSAKSGDVVRIVMLDVEDSRPVEDVVCSDEDYQDIYESAGLVLTEVHKPLADPGEPRRWISETEIAPWVIYVVKSAVV